MAILTGPWTQVELARIRTLIGFPSLFLSQIPRLDMALKAVQSEIDGGSEPTDAVQQRMRLVVEQLDVIDCQIAQMNQLSFVQATGTDQVKINPIKAIFLLRSNGRNLIGQLCVPLGLNSCIRDYYSPMNENANEYSPFMINDR